MKFERITSKKDKLFNEVYTIYEYSFPMNERRDIFEFERVLNDERLKLYALLDDKLETVGLLSYWLFNDMQTIGEYMFVEHFAIDKNLRGTGLGKICVNYLKAQNLPIILEIESPTTDIAIKRERFYQSLGFIKNVHSHMQPPFHKGDIALELMIMSYPKVFNSEEYLSFKSMQLEVMPKL